MVNKTLHSKRAVCKGSIRGEGMDFVYKNQVKLVPEVRFRVVPPVKVFKKILNVCICTDHQIAGKILIPIFVVDVNQPAGMNFAICIYSECFSLCGVFAGRNQQNLQIRVFFKKMACPLILTCTYASS
jgi:hypothetical protein